MYMWIVAGMIVGYYFLKDYQKPVFNTKVAVVSIFLTIVGLVFIVLVDQILLKNLPFYVRIPGVCLHRYFCGFAICFFFPKLIFYIFGPGKKLKNS